MNYEYASYTTRTELWRILAKKKLNCGEATETHGRHNQFFINANTYFMVEKIDVGASQIVIS
jgi:hypothetical protein